MQMTEQTLNAVQAKYQAAILEAKANLSNYFNNSVGVGEHPNIVTEIDKLVGQISDAEGKLETIANLVNEINEGSNNRK
jgi:hypothetical protein